MPQNHRMLHWHCLLTFIHLCFRVKLWYLCGIFHGWNFSVESACKLDQVKRSVAFIVFVCVAVLFVLSVNFIGKNECPKNAYREWHRA